MSAAGVGARSARLLHASYEPHNDKFIALPKAEPVYTSTAHKIGSLSLGDSGAKGKLDYRFPVDYFLMPLLVFGKH